MTETIKENSAELLDVRPDFDVVIVVEKAAITFYFSEKPEEALLAVLRSLIQNNQCILADTTQRDNCGEEATLSTPKPSLCCRLKVSPVFDIFKLASTISGFINTRFALRTNLVNESGVLRIKI